MLSPVCFLLVASLFIRMPPVHARATGFSTSNTASALIDSPPDFLNLTTNPWYAPGANDKRSPCVFLNTLANHGFINRNGTSIKTDDIIRKMEEVFSFSPELTYLTKILPAIDCGQTYEDNLGNIRLNLQGLSAKKCKEFRSILVRSPDNITFINWTLMSDLVAINDVNQSTNAIEDFRSIEGHLSLEDIAVFQYYRIFDVFEATTNDSSFNIAGAEFAAIETLSLGMIGTYPVSMTVEKDRLFTFMVWEQLPSPFSLSKRLRNFLDINDPWHDFFRGVTASLVDAINFTLSGKYADSAFANSSLLENINRSDAVFLQFEDDIQFGDGANAENVFDDFVTSSMDNFPFDDGIFSFDDGYFPFDDTAFAFDDVWLEFDDVGFALDDDAFTMDDPGFESDDIGLGIDDASFEFDDNFTVGVDDNSGDGYVDDVVVEFDDAGIGSDDNFTVGVDDNSNDGYVDDVVVGFDDEVIGFDDNFTVDVDDNHDDGFVDDVVIGLDDADIGSDDNFTVGVDNSGDGYVDDLVVGFDDAGIGSDDNFTGDGDDNHDDGFVDNVVVEFDDAGIGSDDNFTVSVEDNSNDGFVDDVVIGLDDEVTGSDDGFTVGVDDNSDDGYVDDVVVGFDDEVIGFDDNFTGDGDGNHDDGFVDDVVVEFDDADIGSDNKVTINVNDISDDSEGDDRYASFVSVFPSLASSVDPTLSLIKVPPTIPSSAPTNVENDAPLIKTSVATNTSPSLVPSTKPTFRASNYPATDFPSSSTTLIAHACEFGIVVCEYDKGFILKRGKRWCTATNKCVKSDDVCSSDKSPPVTPTNVPVETSMLSSTAPTKIPSEHPETPTKWYTSSPTEVSVLLLADSPTQTESPIGPENMLFHPTEETIIESDWVNADKSSTPIPFATDIPTIEFYRPSDGFRIGEPNTLKDVLPSLSPPVLKVSVTNMSTITPTIDPTHSPTKDLEAAQNMLAPSKMPAYIHTDSPIDSGVLAELSPSDIPIIVHANDPPDSSITDIPTALTKPTYADEIAIILTLSPSDLPRTDSPTANIDAANEPLAARPISIRTPRVTETR